MSPKVPLGEGQDDDRGRRRSERRPLRGEVEVLGRGGVVINASEGGLAIGVQHPIPVDTIVTVRIELAGGAVSMVLARVAWTRPHGSGHLLGLEVLADETEALPTNPRARKAERDRESLDALLEELEPPTIPDDAKLKLSMVELAASGKLARQARDVQVTPVEPARRDAVMARLAAERDAAFRTYSDEDEAEKTTESEILPGFQRDTAPSPGAYGAAALLPAAERATDPMPAPSDMNEEPVSVDLPSSLDIEAGDPLAGADVASDEAYLAQIYGGAGDAASGEIGLPEAPPSGEAVSGEIPVSVAEEEEEGLVADAAAIAASVDAELGSGEAGFPDRGYDATSEEAHFASGTYGLAEEAPADELVPQPFPDARQAPPPPPEIPASLGEPLYVPGLGFTFRAGDPVSSQEYVPGEPPPLPPAFDPVSDQTPIPEEQGGAWVAPAAGGAAAPDPSDFSWAAPPRMPSPPPPPLPPELAWTAHVPEAPPLPDVFPPPPGLPLPYDSSVEEIPRQPTLVLQESELPSARRRARPPSARMMPAVEPRPAPDPVSEAARPIDTLPMSGEAPMAPVHTQPLARVGGRPAPERAHPMIDAPSGMQRVDTLPLARPDGTPVAPVRSLADETLAVSGSLAAPVDTLELMKDQLPGHDVADTLDVPPRGGPFRDTLELQREELPEPIRRALERIGGSADDTISDDGEEEEPSIDIEVDEPIILAKDHPPTEDDSDEL